MAVGGFAIGGIWRKNETVLAGASWIEDLQAHRFMVYLLVGYHGEPKVNLFDTRIMQGFYYPKKLKVTYSTTRFRAYPKGPNTLGNLKMCDFRDRKETQGLSWWGASGPS